MATTQPTTQLGTPGAAIRDGLGNVVGGYDTSGAAFRFGTLPQSTATPPSTKDARILPEPNLPEPNADKVMEGYVGSLTGDLANQRKAVEDAYKRQLDDVQRQQAEAQKRIDEFNKKQEQVIEGGMEDNLKPFREQLENSERNRLSINENFEANQKLVRELETLLTQSNNMMDQLRSSKIPGLAGISQSPRAIQALQDVSARVGVIQAVMNARSGQIAEGYRMIDRSLDAVNADRKDQLNYYSTIYDFYQNQKDEEGKQLFQLNQEEQKWINSQIKLLEDDMASSKATADYIKELMISPESAKFMADAGVTLNDSVETIQKKMAAQAETEERREQAKQNVKDLFDAGITTTYANKNGELVRVADGWSFKDPEEFKKMTGMTIEEAQAKGMISDYNADVVASRSQVQNLMEKYFDAGIKPGDTIDQAVSKVMSASAIYREQVRPPSSGSGPGDESGIGGENGGIFSGLIQEGLLAGDTPEDAVLNAIAIAEQMGISVDKKSYGDLLNYARSVSGKITADQAKAAEIKSKVGDEMQMPGVLEQNITYQDVKDGVGGVIKGISNFFKNL